jgi:hypothetical protein
MWSKVFRNEITTQQPESNTIIEQSERVVAAAMQNGRRGSAEVENAAWLLATQWVNGKRPIASQKQHIPWRPEGAEYIEHPCLISKGGFESERFFKLEDGCIGVCDVTYCTPEHGPGFVLARVIKRFPERVVLAFK